MSYIINKEIDRQLEIIKEASKKILKSKKTAREFLITMNMIDARGNNVWNKKYHIENPSVKKKKHLPTTLETSKVVDRLKQILVQGTKYVPGIKCICNAHGASECGCGANWEEYEKKALKELIEELEGIKYE